MRWIRASLMAIVIALVLVAPTLACTGITLHAADGSVVRGRTMEFGNPLDSEVIFFPRGVTITGTTADNVDDGLAWETKYATVGVNGVGLPIVIDGLNEKGLSGGIFYFPDYAEFQDVTAANTSKTIAPWQLITWALTSFSTVDEVRAALPEITVGNIEFAAWKMIPPMHYVMTDATGQSIVIEYVGGELSMYDNPLGVFTNAPAFDWHMTNLRNYIGISPKPAEAVDLSGVNLDPLSTGGNLFGMPGDFSSPSRFVRATVFSHMSPESATGQDAVMQGFHILDNFDIPEGAVPEPAGSDPPYETTEWTTMSNLKALTFYVWTSDNRAIRTVNLNDMDLDGTEMQLFPLDQPQEFIAIGS